MRDVPTKAAPPRDRWVYSPDPAVEAAVHRWRADFPRSHSSSLDAFRHVMAQLGDPQKNLPPVFHVAGTNGKGSVLAFLQAVLQANGKSVHKYISPHLVRVEERIVLNGRMIEPSLLTEVAARVEPVAKAAGLSFFGLLTALGFVAFDARRADAALLETGMGGLHDATNIVAGEAVSILTRISYDHMRALGPDLPSIARHKAGIIKPGRPVVVAPQQDDTVTDLFITTAENQGAASFVFGRDWHVREEREGFVYESKRHRFSLPPPALSGAHQILNAGAAIAALECSGFDMPAAEVLARGLQAAVWPARLQRLTGGRLAGMLPSGWELWLDGAHNDSGAEVLAQQAARWGKEKSLHLLTAAKHDKDAPAFYCRFSPFFADATPIVFDIDAPMLPPAALVAGLARGGFADIHPVSDLREAIERLVFSFPKPGRIVVAGSLYLAGHALRVNAADDAAG